MIANAPEEELISDGIIGEESSARKKTPWKQATDERRKHLALIPRPSILTVSNTMSHTMEPLERSLFSSDPGFNGSRQMTILPAAISSTTLPQPDAMEITPPATATLLPPHNSSPEAAPDSQRPKAAAKNGVNGFDNTGVANGLISSSSATSTNQQPKVVQTAFIHKLYGMLEDQSIKHLICWSDTADSFIMFPSTEFSRVLAQYFKHTNVSSFVRQLNMYGFHKVNDVFHNGPSDSASWEFKHGNGNFKRGDVAGLREIKRRASKHALVQRPESFVSTHKASISQPGTPAEPIPDLPSDARLANVEASLYEFHTRLMRTEESNTALSTKCAFLNDSLMKYHRWTIELAQVITNLLPDHDNPLFTQVVAVHNEMLRHADDRQRIEDGHDPMMSGRPHFSNLTLDAGSLSPRQRAQDDRRGSNQAFLSKTTLFRTPAPPHLSISPRRFGSIGAQGYSPFHRIPPPIQPPVPPTQHPLASVEPSPNLARRHTSADIRDTVGWPPQVGAIPFEAPQTSSSSNWPPSPPAPIQTQGDASIQSSLASYSMGASPPAPESTSMMGVENGFIFKTPNYGNRHSDNSAPPTRRGSIAHLLNINDSSDTHEEDGNDDRKRRRL